MTRIKVLPAKNLLPRAHGFGRVGPLDPSSYAIVGAHLKNVTKELSDNSIGTVYNKRVIRT
jgi:hypothetical protein